MGNNDIYSKIFPIEVIEQGERCEYTCKYIRQFKAVQLSQNRHMEVSSHRGMQSDAAT